MPLSSDLLSRASRVFNAGVDLRNEDDRSINEWLKDAIAQARTREAKGRGCPDHADDPYPGGCPDCMDIAATRPTQEDSNGR